jgi:tetratricopeptide (TPR) repeat protein
MESHHFISYSRNDGEDLALRLCDALKSGTPPLTPWIDQRAIRVGMPWDDQVERAIDNCATMVFLLTHDSSNQASQCRSELRRAIALKKPITPILVHEDANPPMIIQDWQYIDFTDDIEKGISRLCDHLVFLATPEGELETLKIRLRSAEHDRDKAHRESDRKRAEKEIDKLKEDISRCNLILADPAGARDRTDTSIRAGIEREREPAREKDEVESRGPVARTIKTFREGFPPYFQDRHMETKLIAHFLREPAMTLCSVIGRGGIGKTAMVYRILESLEHNRLPDDLGPLDVGGIRCFSAVSEPRITVGNICEELISLIPDDAMTDTLHTQYRDERIPTRERIRDILEALPRGRYVLLLDNLEDITDWHTRRLEDKELNEMLCAFLETPHHGVKIILTSRIPLADLPTIQPGRQLSLNLDEGLPTPFAENILREKDADGSLGLRDAPDALLAEARERTRGYPRALEMLFGVLAADRSTSLEDILEDTRQVLPEKVLDVLVGEQFNRLDATSKSVLQALAVYARPVPVVAVDFLLQPSDPAVNSGPVLGRLVNYGIVRKETDTARYYIHQIDIQYALSRLSKSDNQGRVDGAQVSPEINKLRKRAQEYYQQVRKPRDTWKSIDDLEPHLAEFDQCCAIIDYEAALQVAVDISGELQTWGFYRQAASMYEQLAEHVRSPRVRPHVLFRLAQAYRELGRIQEAIGLIDEAIGLIEQEQANTAWLHVMQNFLGMLYDDLGDTDRAMSLYRKALELSSDQSRTGSILSNIGLIYAELGKTDQGILYSLQAAEIVRSIGNSISFQCSIGNVAHYLIDAGRLDQALHILRRVVEDADKINNIQQQHHCRYKMAQALLHKGEIDEARRFVEDALQYDVPESMPRVMAVAGIIALRQGDREDAKAYFVKALDRSLAILKYSPRHIWAHYTRVLAFSGLSLCDSGRHLADAAATCRSVEINKKDAGIVARVLRFLNEFRICDHEDQLSAVRDAVGVEPPAAGSDLYCGTVFVALDDTQADLARILRPVSLRRSDWTGALLARVEHTATLFDRFHRILEEDALLDGQEFMGFVKRNAEELGDLRVYGIGLLDLISKEGKRRRMFLISEDGAKQLTQLAAELSAACGHAPLTEAREAQKRGMLAAWASRSITSKSDYAAALEVIQAEYERAYEIDPDDAQNRTAVIEIGICLGRYANSIQLAESLLPTIVKQPWRGVCHWLVAIACILDGRSADPWINAEKELQHAARCFGGLWHPDDIEKHLKEFAADHVPSDRVAAALAFHDRVRKLQEQQQ